VVATPRRGLETPHGHRSVTMECVSTAIVLAIVAGLMLLGIGMVINQLVRLKRYLKDPPTSAPASEEPPDQPS